MPSFAPTRPDLATTLRLAAPVALVQLGMMAMGLVDTAFVGRVSEDALAAMGLGGMWSWGAMTFGLGALYAVGPLLAQAHGAGDAPAFGRALRRGLVLVVLHSALATLVHALCEPALLALGQTPEVASGAAAYVWRTMPGTLPFYVFAVVREALQATHRMRPIVIVIVGANLLNVVVDYALVAGNLGFPALGAEGAAWATSIARVVMGIGLVASAWPILGRDLRAWTRSAFAVRPLVRLTQLGVPVGGQALLEFSGFAAMIVLMGRLGVAEIGAHQVTLLLAATAFMVPLGVSQASGVLVGNAVGRADADGARRAAGAGMLVGVGFMSVTAILFLATPGPLARLMTDEADVLAIAVVLLPLAGVFQVFDGLQVVASGILRGVADVHVPFAINLFAYWGVAVPVGYWLAFSRDAGPPGLWWGLVAGLAVAAVLLGARVLVHLSRPLVRARVD